MEEQDKNVNEVEHSKDKSKKKKVLKYVLNGAVWGVILGFLVYSGLRVIDVKSGYKLLPSHSAVIVSGSMSYVNEANYSYLDKDVKHIQVNDVVHTTNYNSFDEVKKLDVVLYLTEKGTLICHRVVNKYVDQNIQYVVTRGDANNTDDAPVKYDLIRGKVTSITGGGKVVLFFQSPYFVLALCGTGFFILLGYLISNIKNEKAAAGIDNKIVGNEVKIEQVEIKEEKEIIEKSIEEKKPEHVEKPMVQKETPARVNGRFVSKNKASQKPKNSSRWTKENNPFTNKRNESENR